MITIVTYDITDPRRLQRFAKFLREYGLRSQKSVFECRLTESEIREIRSACRDRLDLATDAVRIYRVCSGCKARAVVLGKGIKLKELGWELV